MKFGALLLSCIATFSALSADEVAIGRLRVTLPEGYRHVPAEGIDTVVGSFQSEDGSCEIYYDLGPLAGSAKAGELAEKRPDLVFRDKKIPTGLGEGRFVAIRLRDNAKFIVLFEAPACANFYAINLTKQQVDDFESIARSLLLVSEPPTKISEAEQGGAGQPATHSDSDSEGKGNPQPESEGRTR